MFWADNVAKQIIEKFGERREYVIVTGTSMSGEPHIGNASDLIRGEAVRIALNDLGKKAKLIWVSDDMDPFRSVPLGFPEEFKDYLGFPVSMVPDPHGCHESFARHYELLFLNQLKDLEIRPKPYFGIEMYRKGMYNKSLRKAVELRKEIMKVLNKYKKEPLPENWYPFNIICEKCHRISTTKVVTCDGIEAEYFCDPQETILHKKYIVRGCGYRGKVNILDGNAKLAWRVEWPARWAFLKCVCEPFGKEHAAHGGSWDTGKELVKLFGWEAPVPVIYEHIQVMGEKMSKSKGNVITIPMLLEVMSAPEIKFWLNFGKITKAKDINLRDLPLHNAFEFDKAEKIFFGVYSTNNPREDLNYKRAYEISTNKEFHRPLNLEYDFAALLSQLFGCKLEKVKNVLIRTGHYQGNGETDRRIKLRLKNAFNWVQKYAPENYRLKGEGTKVELNELEARQFRELMKVIEEVEDSEVLQQRIYEVARIGDVKEFFRKCYLALIGKGEGPRLANLIIALGKKEVVKRLGRSLE
ncbi:MAG: lysine--tRNA ligase [Candidatus Nanoarchaeia archaeon]|nr:lysine--tRNA ligase [Candidatus Haiyanarchaeum thermophilum]MCW1302867.1 lysine--tRNA ligase [Candidatus Haiyanarchaeum thermophilum]MCW1303547.1 lysine--tRNA ligase [Candidatus Haiyanarchaeum thermophilum]MCW1306229.1 lysine--tRNA ligase [Candidatus Haiyanarchaeum thermophilum]MCW1307317.1 lysine--tRNA ligase [Candidatus Haiyanarchaeum thermophilum]